MSFLDETVFFADPPERITGPTYIVSKFGANKHLINFKLLFKFVVAIDDTVLEL